MKELPTPTFAFSPVAIPRRSLHQSVHALVQRATDAISGIRTEALSVSWARHQDEVREAQRMRYQVFALEMGASLPQTVSGHDIDVFDDYCEHLLVRDADSRQVIGTYRVLTPAQARRAGRTYSDTEFDLTALFSLRERMVELGRSMRTCRLPARRRDSGAVERAG